jgi:hypothetical protein
MIVLKYNKKIAVVSKAKTAHSVSSKKIKTEGEFTSLSGEIAR